MRNPVECRIEAEADMVRIAVLDDYQNVALKSADWSVLPANAEVRVFNDHVADQAMLIERLRDFEVVCAMRERTPLTGDIIAALPKLKLIVTTGLRNASIDVKAAGARGVMVCGTNGVGHPTAELTWALILGLMRHIGSESATMRQGRWQSTVGRSVKGKVLGVIGLGKLGAQVARIGGAFGMEVIAWSENLTARRAAEVGARLVDKETLLREADVVTIHLVLSGRSRGLISGTEFGLMKPDACIVNTSRGPIIDEAALVETLKAGRIGGAGLDVYDVEPLPANHALRGLPNVLLTPHLGYVTDDTYAVFYRETVGAVKAWLDGVPVRVIEP